MEEMVSSQFRLPATGRAVLSSLEILLGCQLE